MTEQRNVVLDEDQAATIRKALRIGLTCYGEIEHRRSAVAQQEASGEKVPKRLRMLHPTGTCDVVGDFAAALSYLS